MRFTSKSLTQSLENTAEPAFAVDAGGKISAWNTVAETALGILRRNALGKSCIKVICGKDAFGYQVCQRECHVFQSLRDRKPVRRFRMHVRAGTGHYVEAECAILGLVDAAGETTVIHLLQLWPNGNHAPVPHSGRRDTRELRQRVPSLTPREMEVLSLLAAARNTKQMSEQLHVSQATVRTHVEHILSKLQVHSRLEAVVVAARENLL
jgi:DNA-binding CsgD family transcriptional regulator